MNTARKKHAPTITIESEVDDETARRFYGLYVETFGELATRAVARQLLHEDEFMAEMTDPRVDKYLAWDEDGQAVAMCTLTNHLETVPWISPDYFSHHYPEHTARNAVYYLGFILVAGGRRREHLFTEMISQIVDMLVEERAMCAWDVCRYNNEELGLSAALEALLQEVAEATVVTMDTQSYYSATAVERTGMSHLRALPPAQRSTLDKRPETRSRHDRSHDPRGR
jgi:hypothetical protein